MLRERKGGPAVLGLLDIGTHKVCCIIAAAERGLGDGSGALSSYRVAGIGHQRSRGVKAGIITDLNEAERAVRAAVAQAETMAGLQLEEVVVSISCGRLRSSHFCAHCDIASGTVRTGDIQRLMNAARAYPERDGRTVLYLDRLAYRLDGDAGVLDPRGMTCRRLSADLHAVTADDAPLRNLMLLIERCFLGVAAAIPAPLAAALAVTDTEERRLGVTCLDIGAGMTNISVFSEGQFLYADGLPVGGNHLSFDIARELRTPLAEAERIKALYGTVVAAGSDEHETITYPLMGEDEPTLHHTTKARLRSILQPRVENLLLLASQKLQRSGIASHAGERMVLTGGTSQLVGIAEFAANVLNRPVRVGRPQVPSRFPSSLSNPAFSTAIGLLVAAREMGPFWTPSSGVEEPQVGYVGRIGQWLRESF
jgi:cell division protein FtsA